jgi:predicted anti-sigma-YlaC factor YlaD
MGQLSSTDCDRYRGYISASLDAELSEVEGARLDAHLGLCAACRAYAVEARRTTRLLRAAPLEDLDFPIVLPSRRLAVARRLQVAAAAAALVVTLGLSAVVGAVGGGGSGLSTNAASSSAQNAKLRFTEDELRMLYQASSARERLSVHARLAL